MREYRISCPLGHASTKTTLHLYGHHLPEEDDAFREGLDAFYRETKTVARAGFSAAERKGGAVMRPKPQTFTGCEGAVTRSPEIAA